MIDQIIKLLPNLVQNPKIEPTELHFHKKTCLLVQEGALLFGTKQRAIVPFIKEIIKQNNKITTILYVCGYNGSGAAAIAYAAYICKLKCKIIIAYKTEEKLSIYHDSKGKASLNALSAEISYTKTYGEARIKADAIMKKSKKGTIFYPAMGFNTELWRNILSKQLRHAASFIKNDPDKTIWVTAGSGSIAMSLHLAFPAVTLCLYLSGGDKYQKIIREWAADKPNVILIPQPLHLEDNPQVPYPTVKDYDDYIYPYFSQYAADGDIIWNIASDDINIPV